MTAESTSGPAAGLSEANVTTMFSQLTSTYVGKVVSDVVTVLVVTSSFASLLSLHNAVTRYGYSLGRDGVLPRHFGRAHSRHHSPYYASTVISVMSLIATAVIAAATGFDGAGVDAYTIYIRVNGLGTIAVLFLMCCVSLAVLGYFRRHRTLRAGRAWSTLVAPALGLLGLVAIFVLALANVGALIGASTGVSIVLTAVLPLVFVAGLGHALRLRSTDTATYQKIGRQ
ncbi:amino acid permease [Sphaerisporangium sp. NPDC051017]|uniref:amino acid permease n=1 Tax=Sphaerisporangium sp. NPDC051017 TaxID=3154636 RepID=UPI0034272A21